MLTTLIFQHFLITLRVNLIELGVEAKNSAVVIKLH